MATTPQQPPFFTLLPAAPEMAQQTSLSPSHSLLYSPEWMPTVDFRPRKNITFNLPLALVPAARCVLYQRYHLCLASQSQYTVEWLDRSQQPVRTLTLPPAYSSISTIPTSFPSELHHTKIQLNAAHLNSPKIVTITLYYTTGTVLVQGHCSAKWITEEFKGLISTINYLATTTDHSSKISYAEESLSSLPLPPTTTVSSPSRSQSLPPLQTTRRTSRRLRGASPCHAFLDRTRSLSPHPISPQSHSSGDLEPYPTCLTPPSTTAPLLITPSLPTSTAPANIPPVPSDHIITTLNAASTQQEPSAPLSISTPIERQNPSQPLSCCDCAASYKQMYSDLEDLRKSIKTELKLHMKTKFDSLVSTLENMQTNLLSLEKQNNDLKSQVYDLKKNYKNVQMFACQKSTSTHTQTDASVQLPVSVSGLMDNSMCTAGSEAACATSGSVCPPPTICPSTSLHHPSPVPTASAAHHSHMNQNTPSSPIINYPNQSGIPTTNLERQSFHLSPITPTPKSPGPSMTEKKSTPLHRLSLCHVDINTTHLLLGDSVVSPLKTSLLFPQTAHQNISVAGLKVEDIHRWLISKSPNRNIKFIIMHVGVNTCKYTSVPESAWTKVIQETKRAFPNATLKLSSIVPCTTVNSFRKTILLSNFALQSACKKGRAVFVDHTLSFITRDGVARSQLYMDNMHPNRNGTAVMARNLREVKVPDHTITAAGALTLARPRTWSEVAAGEKSLHLSPPKHPPTAGGSHSLANHGRNVAKAPSPLLPNPSPQPGLLPHPHPYSPRASRPHRSLEMHIQSLETHPYLNSPWASRPQRPRAMPVQSLSYSFLRQFYHHWHPMFQHYMSSLQCYR